MRDVPTCLERVFEGPQGVCLPYARWGEAEEDHAAGARCGDCGVMPGGWHHPGCDMERCPRCGGQAIGCCCFCSLQDLTDRCCVSVTHPVIERLVPSVPWPPEAQCIADLPSDLRHAWERSHDRWSRMIDAMHNSTPERVRVFLHKYGVLVPLPAPE